MLGTILRWIRNYRKLSLMDLKNKTGLSKSALSNIENGINNPTVDTLNKICSSLGVDSADVLKLVSKFESAEEVEFMILEDNIDDLIKDLINERTNNIESNIYFDNAREAIKFILEQPAVMGYGGFDINKLSDEEIIEFANDLLIQLRNLGYKYKR